MNTTKRILLIVALICFLAAAIGIDARVGLVPLGLGAWILTAVL